MDRLELGWLAEGAMADRKTQRATASRRNIDLQQLASFVSAADLGSLSAAARIHGVSQPAITGQLARLEAHLGTQLVYRNRVGVQVTPAGSTLLVRAKAILKAVDDVADEITRFRRRERN